VRTVGLKVLKNKLAEYVRLAAQGERVLIADRDRVVAELVPPEAGRAERVSDAVLAGLVREGIVSPALTPGRPLRADHPRGARLAEILAELGSDRGER
jgi:antitoxin (DNA-binding transcriptional repressor) of toxin-antitoxin stability system